MIVFLFPVDSKGNDEKSYNVGDNNSGTFIQGNGNEINQNNYTDNENPDMEAIPQSPEDDGGHEEITYDIGDNNSGIFVLGDNNAVNQNTYNYTSNPDAQTLLRQAELYYEKNDIENAIDLYLNSILQDDPIALCNLGYFYETGDIGYDLDKAIEYYEQVDTDYGKRHLLKAYIMSRDENNLNAARDLIDELWDIDPYVRDYFFYCNYGCSEADYLENHPGETEITFSFEGCYQWEATNEYCEASGSPANNTYTQWVVVSVDYTGSHTVLRFRKYTLKYLDVLNAGFVNL